MTRLIRIQPAPGRQVRDRAGEVLRGPVAVDPRDPYWRRRLAAGDMVPSPEPKPRQDRKPRAPAKPRAVKPVAPSPSPSQSPRVPDGPAPRTSEA